MSAEWTEVFLWRLVRAYSDRAFRPTVFTVFGSFGRNG
jgi:hypothetical protein